MCFIVKEFFGNHETAIIFSILYSQLVLYSEPVAVARSYPVLIMSDNYRFDLALLG